ncbi:MAG: hypothetical protein RR333_08400, partial [Bacteroidales bacterium]
CSSLFLSMRSRLSYLHHFRNLMKRLQRGLAAVASVVVCPFEIFAEFVGEPRLLDSFLLQYLFYPIHLF